MGGVTALGRPQGGGEQPANEGTPDVADIAAYAFGLAKNHPFADGNKRVALRELFFSLSNAKEQPDGSAKPVPKLFLAVPA